MADAYLKLVNSPPASGIAKKLGLPRPAELRRYRRGQPLVPGPALVLASGPAEGLAGQLAGWGLEVRRDTASGEKLGAIILDLTTVSDPRELSGPMLAAGASLRTLAPGGRVVSISRPAASAPTPAAAAARQGVQGAVRSLARELRAGATANGLLLADGVGPVDPNALGGLQFLLSARSAYVDGQFLLVGPGGGRLPKDADRPLAERTAVVTGAARGIGAAIAKVLHRDGARVICVDLPAAGEELAKVSNAAGGIALQLDITSDDAGARILEHARSRYGGLDIMVHNAGITRDKLLANMDQARWDSVIDVNMAAQLRINDALLASGADQAPRVVCLASTSGIAGNRGQTNYAASKAGVIGMVAASAAAFADRGGAINAVAPGFIETEMTARIPWGTREVARRMLPSLQQGGLPVDVAEAVAFLAGDAAGGVNGQTLRVCGQSLVGA